MRLFDAFKSAVRVSKTHLRLPSSRSPKKHAHYYPLIEALERRLTPSLGLPNGMVNDPSFDALTDPTNTHGDTQSETSTISFLNSTSQNVVLVAYNDFTNLGSP